MKITLAAAAALVVVTTVASPAADLAVKAPMLAPAPASSWTGFYVGGNLGGGVAASHFDDPDFTASSATPTAGFFTGGAQIGYNYQFGNGLIGVEADVNGNSKFKGDVLGGANGFSLAVNSNTDVSGTIRARAGLVINNALIYTTGGAAWASVKQTGAEFCNQPTCRPFNGPTVPFGTFDGLTANSSGTVWGGVIGAGVEFAMSPNWTVGGEFLHTIYSGRGATLFNPNGTNVCVANFDVGGGGANCLIRNQTSTDVARVRVNYKFN